MQPMPKMGINIILVFCDMFKPQMRKTGRTANVKSLMTAMALYRNVRPMMMSMLTQVPPSMCLFQKKLIGEH